jgi:hypothetical protein
MTHTRRTLDEAAADLGVRPRWLRDWLRTRPGLCIRAGRKILFMPDDWANVLEEMRRCPSNSPSAKSAPADSSTTGEGDPWTSSSPMAALAAAPA